jgi:flavin reductase (DIM6/NTAB) family NADH-FMN oxidoreductase RutF
VADLNEDVGQLFRQAMRRFPAAVTVVTARSAEGEDIGMTATAVTSLSMDPPSLLVCINRNTAFHRAMNGVTAFCVSALRMGHETISANFGGAKPLGERFTDGVWGREDGTPYLIDAQTNIFCYKAAVFEHATHSIVVGEVKSLIVHQAVAPLLYINGGYAGIG